MEEKGEDRRIQKTRGLLYDALLSLILEKDYESITIQEIIDRANVGRTTFYAHFVDKDDLLLGRLQRLQDALKAARAESQGLISEPREKLVAFSLPAFEHLYGHRPVYKAIIGSQVRHLVMEYIPVMLANLIKDESRTACQDRKGGDGEIPYDLLVHFVVSTFVSLVSWWLASRTRFTRRRSTLFSAPWFSPV